MIVQCPACNAKFAVPDAAIGAVGRNLRCGKCQHQWFCAPSTATVVAATTAAPAPPPKPAGPDIDALMRDGSIPTPPSQEVPEEKPKKKIKTKKPKPEREKLPALPKRKPGLVAWAACVALLLVNGLLSALMFSPATFGLTPSTGMRLADISFQRLADDKTSSARVDGYRIEGDILNDTADARPTPLVRLSLVDERSRVLKSWNVPPPSPSLMAGDKARFVFEGVEVPKGTIARLRIDLGNPLELALRPL